MSTKYIYLFYFLEYWTDMDLWPLFSYLEITKKMIASSINNTWQINNWGQFIHSPQYGPLLLPNLKLFHKGTTGNLSTELNSCRNIQGVTLVNGIPTRRAWHMDFRRPNKYKNLITCRFKCPYTLTESNTTSARRKET